MTTNLRRWMVVAATLAAVGLLLAVTPATVAAQTRPALIKDVDEAGRVPFQYIASAAAGAASCGANFCNFYLPAIPAGKRLVITDFYGTVSLQPGGTVHSLRLNVWDMTDPGDWVLMGMYEVPHNPAAYYNVALTFELRRYSFQSKLVMYADAGFAPSIEFWTGGANLHASWPSQIMVVGYLVNLTQ